MLFEALLLDIDMNTLLAFNLSICLSVMISYLCINRVEFAFGAPLFASAIIQQTDERSLNKNKSLLIQYFMIKRLTRYLRTRVYSNDDPDSMFSF